MSTRGTRDFVAELKPGDPVIVEVDNQTRRLARVEKVMKLHLVVEGMKYRRANGFRVGSTAWHSGLLREATPELVEEIKRTREAWRYRDHFADLARRTSPEDLVLTLGRALRDAGLLPARRDESR